MHGLVLQRAHGADTSTMPVHRGSPRLMALQPTQALAATGNEHDYASGATWLGFKRQLHQLWFEDLGPRRPLLNYTLLSEPLGHSSDLLLSMVHAAGSGWVSGKPFRAPVPVQTETTLKRGREIGLNLAPV